jgi:hypothetical protein
MSTTATQPHRQPSRIDPADAFHDLIWTDGEICSNCFARVATSQTVQRDDWGNTASDRRLTEAGTRGLETFPTVELGEQTVRHEDGQVIGTEPRETCHYRPLVEPRTTCGECGSVRLLAHHDIMSTVEMVERVPAIAERLREHGVDVSERVMRRTVRRLKSDDRLQGYTKAIFERAVKLGIRHAGR